MSEIKFDEFVSKGWGYEKIIVSGPLYCGKILRFVKGKSCSLHYHRRKTETFHLLSGRLEIWTIYDGEFAEEILRDRGEIALLDACDSEILTPGDTFHLKPGLVHKMTALQDSELLEISTQDFEDDSYRIIKGD